MCYVNAEHVSGSQIFVVHVCIYIYCMNMYVYIYTFMNLSKIALCQRWARYQFTGLCGACAHIYVLYEYVRIYIPIYESIKIRAMSALSTSGSQVFFVRVRICMYYMNMYVCIYTFMNIWKIALCQCWARQQFTGLCGACVHIYVLYEYVRIYMYYLNMYVYIYIYEYIKNCAMSTLSMSEVHSFFLCVCAYICTLWICTYVYTFIHISIYEYTYTYVYLYIY